MGNLFSTLLPFVIIVLVYWMALPTVALELVNDGKPLAEIVISEQADSSVRAAAAELRKNIGKMSGADLAVVTTPSGKTPIYVGQSAYTDKLGIKLDDIKYDGFKVIVTGAYVALLGVDNCRPAIPRDNIKPGPRSKEVQKRWEELTGKKWVFPFNLRDPRNVSQKLGFCYQDATGTLYAVYEFLEQLGMRWFMPVEGLGEVIPERRDINVAPMNLKREPCFASRWLFLCGWGNYPSDTLWLKYLKQGGIYDQYLEHSSENVASLQKNRPELFSYVEGKPLTSSPGRFIPRLASSELRQETAEYLIAARKAFPELDSLPIGQPDGWIALDDRDVAAGWDKKEEGSWGRFSDYNWDFVLDVSSRVRAKCPDATFNVMSYGYAKNIPKLVERIPPYFEICFSQSSQNWHLPNAAGEAALRQEWFNKFPYLKFSLYDYYLFNWGKTPPVPAIFSGLMEKNFKTLPDNCMAICTEVPVGSETGTRLGQPGLTHLMIYLHSKLTWDKNLDVKATLDDYYDKFFGPAKDEMREFNEFAEVVWMRPEPRQITAFSGFLKPVDVDKYFEILDRAKGKAGNTVYGKRIEFIAAEMAPSKNLFKELKRSGPYVRAWRVDIPAKVDGDLSKPFWTERLTAEHSLLRDLDTGVFPDINLTYVGFRWLPDNALLVGITCYERRMGQLKASVPDSSRDEEAIYNDDDIELFIETPNGYNAKVVVNPNGAILDYCVTPNMADVASSWRAEAVAVRKLPDRWTVEIKIKGLGDMPTKSYPWGINVCRSRLTGGDIEGYALSPTGTGRFLAPTKMANLYVP